MRIKTEAGIWERQSGLSDVAKIMVRQGDPTDKDTGKIMNCLVCADMGVERPGVCKTLFQLLKNGEEAMAAMTVCRAHRAQWRFMAASSPLDGQHRVST